MHWNARRTIRVRTRIGQYDAARRSTVHGWERRPGTLCFPGFSLHAELERLVKVGFSPTQALQSATLDPALFLAKLDKFGVVEAGRAADLVLLEANPLEDIRNTSKIAAVISAGKYYSRQDLDKMLTQVAELARNR